MEVGRAVHMGKEDTHLVGMGWSQAEAGNLHYLGMKVGLGKDTHQLEGFHMEEVAGHMVASTRMVMLVELHVHMGRMLMAYAYSLRNEKESIST